MFSVDVKLTGCSDPGLVSLDNNSIQKFSHNGRLYEYEYCLE